MARVPTGRPSTPLPMQSGGGTRESRLEFKQLLETERATLSIENIGVY
jgi:hypothetical protein